MAPHPAPTPSTTQRKAQAKPTTKAPALSPLGEAALAYAALGYAVFPCKPKEKHPATKNGVHDATKDAAQIRAWWASNPNANIGLALGKASGIVALDFDRDAGENWPAFLSQLDAQGLPHPAHQTTGSGVHALYSLAGGAWASGTELAAYPPVKGEKAEIIGLRSDGQYIIVAPSVHPSGKAYAGNLGRKLAPPLDPGALAAVAKIARGFDKRPTTPPPAPTPQPPAVVAQSAPQKARPPLASLVKMLWELEEAKPVQWLVSGFLERGELCLITGKPGSQKSFLTLDLALCVASGQSWLPDESGGGGRAVAKGGVLWVNTDNGKSHDPRARALKNTRSLPDDTPLYSLTLSDWSLSDNSDTSELTELAQAAGVALVVIDTLASSAAGVNENENGAMGVIWNKVKRLRDETGAAVIVIHHPPKADSEGIRGAGASEGVLDKWYMIDRPERGNTLALKCQKYRNYPPALSLAVQSKMELEGLGDDVMLVGAAFYAGEGAQEEAKRERLESSILEAAMLGAKNKSALVKAVKGASAAAKYAAINDLIERGAIRLGDEGRILSLEERETANTRKSL